MAKSLDMMIEDHVNLWLKWIACDRTARDVEMLMSERKKAAQECESIVNQKYASIREIDEYFDGIKKS